MATRSLAARVLLVTTVQCMSTVVVVINLVIDEILTMSLAQRPLVCAHV